jgi:ATP-dependent protease ClpP protease subunit
MKENQESEIWGKPKSDDDIGGDGIKVIGNTIYFYSDVSELSILALSDKLHTLSNKLEKSMIDEGGAREINLHISSYGGSVFAGIAGMEAIIRSPIPVITTVDGKAASAATFLSVVGKTRYMGKHSFMLIHQLSAGMWGKYHEFRDEMKNLDKLMDMIKSVYTEYTSIPEKILDSILEHDLWFDSGQCVQHGLVDGIIT